jgi:O-acetyl-ADP-ribose deacetylase (regulator of RNase III)
MKITVIHGDITQTKADAIVNAANSSLLGGSGVDGAIHRVGGTAILEECQQLRNKQGSCKTGQAVITTAGNLPAQKVIHTVGPVYHGNLVEKGALLASCYRESLLLAQKNGLQSIAFPNISTGIYRFPKGEAAQIAIQTVQENPILQEVLFVCWDIENYKIYKKLLIEH